MNKLQKTNTSNSGLVIIENNTGLNVFSDNLIIDPVEQYKLSLKSKHSERTLITRMIQCAKIWGFSHYSNIEWHKIKKIHVIGIIKTLESQNKSIRTIRVTLSMIKMVVKEAYDLDLITVDEYQRIANIKSPRGSVVDTGKALTREEVKKAYDLLEEQKTLIDIRDNAIIRLLFGTGLRRSEVVEIKIKDIDFENSHILIHGKGNKERIVGLNKNTMDSILKWYEASKDVDEDNKESFLFSRILKSGKIIDDKPLSSQTIYNIIIERFSSIGIKIKTHDTRKTFATLTLENTEIHVLSKMLGHSSIETTKIYDKSNYNKVIEKMKNNFNDL